MHVLNGTVPSSNQLTVLINEEGQRKLPSLTCQPFFLNDFTIQYCRSTMYSTVCVVAALYSVCSCCTVPSIEQCCNEGIGLISDMLGRVV